MRCPLEAGADLSQDPLVALDDAQCAVPSPETLPLPNIPCLPRRSPWYRSYKNRSSPSGTVRSSDVSVSSFPHSKNGRRPKAARIPLQRLHPWRRQCRPREQTVVARAMGRTDGTISGRHRCHKYVRPSKKKLSDHHRQVPPKLTPQRQQSPKASKPL